MPTECWQPKDRPILQVTDDDDDDDDTSKTGVDIAALAMNFTLSNADITTTLVSTASMARLKSNLKSVWTALTKEEASRH